MQDTISVAYHRVLPLERFVALVRAAGLPRISLTCAAVDAFGVIRLRSLLEANPLRVEAVHQGTPGEDPMLSRGLAERTRLLATILEADAVTRADGPAKPPQRITLDAARVHGGSLASLAAMAGGARELHLDPSAWRFVAAQH